MSKDMSRLDLVKLRKDEGMSQKELAELLSVRQSFLSAIENGRSRLPDEKLERIREVFGLEDLTPYMMEEAAEETVVPPHTHSHDETDSIALLLRHIHAQAHREEGGDHGRVAEMEARVAALMDRNDRLSNRIDTLRETIDTLREENFRLKEILARHGLEY